MKVWQARRGKSGKDRPILCGKRDAAGRPLCRKRIAYVSEVDPLTILWARLPKDQRRASGHGAGKVYPELDRPAAARRSGSALVWREGLAPLQIPCWEGHENLVDRSVLDG